MFRIRNGGYLTARRRRHRGPFLGIGNTVGVLPEASARVLANAALHCGQRRPWAPNSVHKWKADSQIKQVLKKGRNNLLMLPVQRPW